MGSGSGAHAAAYAGDKKTICPTRRPRMPTRFELRAVSRAQRPLAQIKCPEVPLRDFWVSGRGAPCPSRSPMHTHWCPLVELDLEHSRCSRASARLVSAGGPAAPGTSPRVDARPTPFVGKNVAAPTVPEVTRRRSSCFVIAAATISAVLVFSSLAEAATVLNVNLSMTIRSGGPMPRAGRSTVSWRRSRPTSRS